MKKEINFLMIANSFGVNLNHYAHQISESFGAEINIGVLYIGGCSLKTHAENIAENKKAYQYYENGKVLKDDVSLYDAFLLRKWDYVALQQFSGESGIYDSYFPYIDQVIEYTRKYLPDAKFILHETWSYNIDCPHPWFPKYDNDFDKMTNAIKNVYDTLSTKYNFPVIRSGELIKFLKSKTDINYHQEDGFHLNPNGEYAIGVLLAITLLNKAEPKDIFVPEGLDLELCTKITKLVNEFVLNK